jgi:ArsR family transcriptional regulator
MATKAQLLERHADQLAALGSPVRLAILRHIVQGDPNGTAVGEVGAKLRIPGSTLSHHLDKLAQAGLTIPRHEGKFIYHRAEFDALRALTNYIWEDCCRGGKACLDPGACCPEPTGGKSRRKSRESPSASAQAPCLAQCD